MHTPAIALVLIALFHRGVDDRLQVPSPVRIAANIAAGDVSHCDHYHQTIARAPVDVQRAVDVGVHLCRNFGTETAPALSDDGRRWLAGTTHCLIDDMESAFAERGAHTGSVSGLIAYTADAHVGCYVAHGFCELSLLDRLALLRAVDGRALRASPRLFPASVAIARAGLTLSGACVARAAR